MPENPREWRTAMIINDSVLQNGEKIIFALRQLYAEHGYMPYRMSKFEEYDLYARNKDFLVSDNVITFTDTNGKLLALKPDVTLSIIKNTTDAPDKTQKVYYNENVYRVSKGTNSFKEIMQVGLECFGAVDEKDICEVILLAAESMRMLSPQSVLDLSNLSLIDGIISAAGLPAEKRSALYQAIGEKNFHEITALCADCENKDSVELLKELISIRGSIGEVLPKLDGIFSASEKNGEYDKFRAVLTALEGSPEADRIRVDFSVVDDVNYYNGIVFKGFVSSVPTVVLSGGQYDNLMRKLQRRSKAIGFAVYTDVLERMEESVSDSAESADDFINIALPKGRLGDRVYDMFARAGFECPSILEPNRKLIFENAENRVRYFWVKPSDVAIYVERGAADVGVAGKDILLEYEPDIYELLDLNTGKCRMAVAAPKTFVDEPSKTLRVATKFSGIAKKYYQSKGRDIDIIHLNGSIEIAPILGLSDVIVDIVETGTTLRENDLEVFETVCPISARLIANKSSYKFKENQIEKIVGGLSAILEENK